MESAYVPQGLSEKAPPNDKATPFQTVWWDAWMREDLARMDMDYDKVHSRWFTDGLGDEMESIVNWCLEKRAEG